MGKQFDHESQALFLAAMSGRIRGKKRTAKVLRQAWLDMEADWLAETFVPSGDEHDISGILAMFRRIDE